jgi:chromosome segregation ATPase
MIRSDCFVREGCRLAGQWRNAARLQKEAAVSNLTAKPPGPEALLLQLRRRLDDAHERLETTHVRLMEAEMALAEARSEADDSQAQQRCAKLENRLAASEARAAETLRQLSQMNIRLVSTERVLNEMERLLRETEQRRAETEDKVAVAEERLATAHGTIAELVSELERARNRAIEAGLHYLGIGPVGLAVARRLSRLTNRFPRTASNAKRVVRVVRGTVRRAA